MVDFPTAARRARRLFPASCLAAALLAATAFPLGAGAQPAAVSTGTV
jgi:peptidoglycan/LPS O-acetylase OafA/YrhL